MTIATQSSSIILNASGVTYPFAFVSPNASDISVIYTTTAGIQSTLTPSQYSVVLNSVPTGGLWSTSGTVTTSTSYASGTITIQRVLPFQQLTTISNQGDFNPQVIEQALDQLCMEIQQVANRTGSYRGIWISGATYNFGDIVQDGVNGNYTNNLYVCSQANTAGTWASDIASGYWQLALNVQTLSATAGYLPLSGGTITGNLVVTGNQVIGASQTVSGATYLAGLATAYAGLTVSGSALTATGTVSGAGFSTYLASPPAIGGTAPAAGAFTTLTVTTSGTIPTISAGSNNTKIINSAYVDRGASGASWVLLGSVTASSTAAIQFTSIPAGYKNYVAVLSDIVPGTVGTNLLAQVSENNGSTWGSGNPYTYGNQFWDYSSTSNSGATTTNFLLAQAVGTAGNGVVGSVLFSALGATGNYKSINSDLTYYYNAVPTPGGYKTTGYYNADTNAINAIQFIMSSGNIASGTISLYGIRNT